MAQQTAAEPTTSKAEQLESEATNSGPLGRLVVYLKALGPGLITGASDDDPSGIGTYKAEGIFKKKGKAFASPTLKNLRAGFDNLAGFETSYGGGGL